MASATDAQNIGVCYGTNGDNLPSAQSTVNLYKSSGITKMRLYAADLNILSALQDSGITLILDVGNGAKVESLGMDPSAASEWVQNYVVPFASTVKFKYIMVGNEMMPATSDFHYPLPAMQNVQNALEAANLADHIKVSTTMMSSALTNTFPPSSSEFSSKEFFSIVAFLKSNGSPLLANIYPYFSLKGDPINITLPYALFTNQGTVFTDHKNDLAYQNLFDALVDCFYVAMEKAGGSGIGIVVSESGWPSDGSDKAIDHEKVAETYYKNRIGHVRNGTPMKQGQPLKTYLFAMYNENEKHGDEVERNFGLFTPQQRNKYGIDSFNG